jgi:hypothetical protein
VGFNPRMSRMRTITSRSDRLTLFPIPYFQPNGALRPVKAEDMGNRCARTWVTLFFIYLMGW